MAVSVSRVFHMTGEPLSHNFPDDDETKVASLSSSSSSLFERSEVSFSSTSSSCPLLSSLKSHDCYMDILSFLSYEDLNKFAAASKECYNIRSCQVLDQTRAGTLSITGEGVKSIFELMEKVRKEKWHKAFKGNRTHLKLVGLNHLSSNIESIDEGFIQKCSPLKHVTSLDCSVGPSPSVLSSQNRQQSSSSSTQATGTRGTTLWLSRYEDYIDKGFAHGLALSLLVPNLRKIEMSQMPLTSLGVAWLAENNPKLECIRWNRSLIWPVNHHAYDIIRACRNLKEIHIDDARLLFCSPRRRRTSTITPLTPTLIASRRRRMQDPENNETTEDTFHINLDHDNDDAPVANENELNEDTEEDLNALWTTLAENSKSLIRVSCRRARWYQNSKFTMIPQESLMKFVRTVPTLRWFRSDLTPENVAILKEERPEVEFCQ